MHSNTKNLIWAIILFVSCETRTNQTEDSTTVDTTVIVAEVIELTKAQKDSLFSEKIKSIIGKKLYRKGYMATDHSYPDDIRNTSNGPVKYAPKKDDSELIVTLNSDHTCEFVFRPIGYKNVVAKTVKWAIGDNNEIVLSDNILVKVEVTNADFPISEDPFYEYILVLKNLKFENNEIIIEERSTSRSNFFVQLAIAQQSGEATNDVDYAYKLLKELKFDYEMVTSYKYYYGF
jgi:hypothetical protein